MHVTYFDGPVCFVVFPPAFVGSVGGALPWGGPVGGAWAPSTVVYKGIELRACARARARAPTDALTAPS